MAIEGPLRELALPDVLQLLHLSRKTGTLTVTGEGFTRAGVLHLDRGAVVGARSPGESSLLGRLLLMAGQATASQVEWALEEQRSTPGRRLGAILVETHGVPAEEVQRQLRFQVEETVFELVRSEEGYFRFEEAAPFPAGPVAIRLSPDSLLMEALRRVDEWNAMAQGRPDTSLVPRLVEEEGSAGPLLTLQPHEWEVLAGVDGERTLRGIARELGRGEFDVAKAVYGLVSAGVVELGLPVARPAHSFAPTGRPELSELERAVAEGRLDEAERRLESLEEGIAGWGALTFLRGQVEARRGRWKAAVRALEASLEQDPLLGNAYLELGMACIRTGDLERAEECLTTYIRLPEAAPRRDAARRATALLSELRRLMEEMRR